MVQPIESIIKTEQYRETHSRGRYEVNTDRSRGMMKVLPPVAQDKNTVKRKRKIISFSTFLRKINIVSKIKIARREKAAAKELAPFLIISKNETKGSKLLGRRRIIDTNLEYLIEWKDTGKREFISVTELEKLQGK